MVDVLSVIVIVVVSACDPLLMVFYGTAAYFGKTWSTAAAYGMLAGLAFVFLSLAIFGQPHNPVFLLARLAACVLGATLARLVINAFRKTKASTPPP
jgi:hypothetical protein